MEDVPQLESVLDRGRTRAMLAGLSEATRGRAAPCPAIVVHSPADVAAAVAALEPSDAVLVKPCVACGVHRAHTMALVLRRDCVSSAVRIGLLRVLHVDH